jgi:hypothetical protein
MTIAILVGVVCVWGVLFAQPVHAFADDLSVFVGYPGGPYYEKASFSDAQLRAMSDGTIYEYSTFDAGTFLRKGFGTGPRLDTVFSSAGVSPWAVWRFYFGTADGYIGDDGGYGEGAWYYSELAGSKFYFPTYPQWYDFGSGTISDAGVDALWASAREVPTIIAVESSFQRVTGPDDPHWDTQTLSTTQGNRLLFGQAGPLSADARFAAHSVRSLTCIMGGRPTITFDVPVVEGRIGESFTVTPHISADDPLVERLGIYDIHWESSDESVATVTQNADGTITVMIVGAGSVSIDARFGDSPLDEFVARAGVGVSGTGTGTGEGTGEGDGTGGGSGTGSGEGSGTGEGDGSGSGDAGDGSGSGNDDGSGSGSGDDDDDDGSGDPGSGGGDNKVDVIGGGQADDGADDNNSNPPEGDALLIGSGDEKTPDQPRTDEPADSNPLIDAAVSTSLPVAARMTKLRLLSAAEALGLSGAKGAEGGGGGGAEGAEGGIIAGFVVNATDDGRVLIYLLAAALCLVFGSVRRIGSYQLAKDHIAAKAARKESIPLSFLVEQSETENPANRASARLRKCARQIRGEPAAHAMDPRYAAAPLRKDDNEIEVGGNRKERKVH